VSERNERETRPDMIFLSPYEKMHFDLILTRRQLDEAIALLRKLQWGDQMQCIICFKFDPGDGTGQHDESCRLARLLQEAK
jgi:hypothetical protein